MTTATTVRFVVPGLAPQATSPNARKNWRARHADGKAYGETVMLIALTADGPYFKEPWERAHVTLTQYAMRLRDHDNFAASFKPGLDAIVRSGIIADDNPSCIDLSLRAVKVAHREQEQVEVVIEKAMSDE